MREKGFKNLIVGQTDGMVRKCKDNLLEAGADIVLTKPLTVSMVVMLISHVRLQGSLSQPNRTLECAGKTLKWVEKA